MNSKRVYIILLGLIAVLFIGLLGGAYGVNQLLHSKSQQLINLKLQSKVLVSQQQGLAEAKKQVAAYSGLNTIAETIVPQDKDQAEAVREISNLAKESGITELSSISFPESTLGGIGGSGITSPPSTTTGGSSSVPNSNLTQLTPVQGVSGLYSLQITIEQGSDSPVPYSEFLTFLSKLEQNRRTAQVTSINLEPDSKDSSLVGFTLIINEFIRP